MSGSRPEYYFVCFGEIHFADLPVFYAPSCRLLNIRTVSQKSIPILTILVLLVIGEFISVLSKFLRSTIGFWSTNYLLFLNQFTSEKRKCQYFLLYLRLSREWLLTSSFPLPLLNVSAYTSRRSLIFLRLWTSLGQSTFWVSHPT